VSFAELAAQDWESQAQPRFLAESGVDSPARKIVAASCATGAFAREQIVGFLLMPTPTLLGMLFVHPTRLRQGTGIKLPEFALSRLESEFKGIPRRSPDICSHRSTCRRSTHFPSPDVSPTDIIGRVA
jgi:hypothetical protein